MSVGSIGNNSSTSTNKANGFAALTSDQFMKVIIQELANQDPLNPQDTGKMLEQFSSLRNIESQSQFQKTMQSMLTQQQITSAGALIGKLVAGLDEKNNVLTGMVTSVRVQDGKAVLELDSGKALALERVTEIAPKTAA